MAKDQDNRPDQNQYHFINETIKEKTTEKKSYLYKASAIAGAGILFGVCAAAAFSAAMPLFQPAPETEEQMEVHVAQADETVTSDTTQEHDFQAETDVVSDGEMNIYLQKYNEIYDEIQTIAAPALKAIVQAEAISPKANLLDDKPLSVGFSQGVILDIRERFIYILLDGSRLPEEKNFRITFADGSSADGILCKRDQATGLLAVKVPIIALDQTTLNEIGEVTIQADSSIERAQMVIAAGNLCGDMNTVLYGMATAVTGKYSVIDAEYTMISTNICGTEESGGALIDIYGNVVGLILGNADGEMIRAISISEVCPLINSLCTEEKVSFLGITGETVSEQKSGYFEIPRGIYVNKVEINSPAANAGILKGDIIQRMDDKTALSMKKYMRVLSEMKEDETIKIYLLRKDAEGKYKGIELETVIEKR